MGKRLFVGNLSWDTQEDDLIDAFEQDGRSVTSARIMTDPDTGRSRGSALVETATEFDDLARADRRHQNGAHDLALAFFNTLGDFNLTLAGEQRHGPHFAQIQAHGIVGFRVGVLFFFLFLAVAELALVEKKLFFFVVVFLIF